MRQFLLALILPLLLVLGQHGRAWHEVQHLRQAVPPSTGTGAGDKRQATDKLCESCLAFAQVAAAAAGQPPLLALARLTQAHRPAAHAVLRAGVAPAPRSRGPPAVH